MLLACGVACAVSCALQAYIADVAMMHAFRTGVVLRSYPASLLCCAAEGGEEAFTSEMVTSAAQAIRQLCIEKPEESKVITCPCMTSLVWVVLQHPAGMQGSILDMNCMLAAHLLTDSKAHVAGDKG